MDFWRVKALENILKLRELNEEQRKQVIKEMIKKARILKVGYLKHENLTNLNYIEKILKTFG